MSSVLILKKLINENLFRKYITVVHFIIELIYSNCYYYYNSLTFYVESILIFLFKLVITQIYFDKSNLQENWPPS